MFSINLLMMLIYFLLVVIIAPYAVTELGASAKLAGLVSSIFIIGTLVGRFFSNTLISRIGIKTCFYVGISVFTIACFLYLIEFELVIFILLRFMHGLFLGFTSTAISTLIAINLPPKRKGEGIGYFSLGTIIATAFGPYLGLKLINYFSDFSLIFTFNIFISCICLLIGLFLIKDSIWNVCPATESASELNKKKSQYIAIAVVPISFLALLMALVYSSITAFFSFYISSLNIINIGSYFFIVFAATTLFARPLLGRLLDQKGPKVVVYPSLISFSIGMLLYSHIHWPFIILLAALFIGFGYGSFISIAQALAIKLVPNEKAGLAITTFFIFFDLGLGLGPYISGIFMSSFGYDKVYFAMTLLVITGILLFYFIEKYQFTEHFKPHSKQTNLEL